MLYQFKQNPNYADVLRVKLKPGIHPPCPLRDCLLYCDTNRGQRWVDGEFLHRVFKEAESILVRKKRSKEEQ